MIGGVIMILTAIWVYQTLIQVKNRNLLWWVAGTAVLFFTTEFLVELFCIEIIDALNGKDIGGEYDPSLTDVGDRKTQEGAGGFFMPVVCELFPSVASVLVVALVRTQFITKQSLTPVNLFSGIKEVFVSIKNSFKTND
ncbi:hypothetical protein KEF85_16295 [Methylomonas paludis]|uniref:Uncharacterized protein n=1 Tax=Methylomonas paludis TaxID=1173101 RepID=A0A975RA27_9GAMM|nr:hypothetical protein [Methylomonas paludis]QWF70849.1 hypothetical protein KEF85_16295 [Methylomonas paludis]